SFIADPTDGAAFRPGFPGRFIPGEQLGEIRRIEIVARRKVLLVRAHRKLVPGAYQLAVITAVDPVADLAPELEGYGTFQLDGEIGNAASCIEFVGTDNRTRRAHIDTRAASSAMRLLRLVDRELDVGVELAQEKPGPGAPIEQVRVLADPPEARFFRDRLLQYRRAVDEDAIAERPDLLLDALRKLSQATPQDLVIVTSQGIA